MRKKTFTFFVLAIFISVKILNIYKIYSLESFIALKSILVT